MRIILLLFLGSMVISGVAASAGTDGLTEADKDYLIRRLQTIRETDTSGISESTTAIPLKSGTRFTMSLQQLRDELDPAFYKTLVVRPSRDRFLDTEHFRIHYDTVGLHAPPLDDFILNPGVPDYVDSTALIFERVWETILDSLDYGSILDNGRPISDGSEGGDSRFDVYITELSFGYYGITWAELSPGDRTAPSYIEVENDFNESPFDALGYAENPMAAVKVTAAHEFFHAIHFSLDLNEQSGGRYWWQEATAVWIEDMVFDEVNDYIFSISYFFDYPWLSLESYTINSSDPPRYMHPYASTVWVRFLQERFDADVVRQIWEICGNLNGYNVLQATNQVLEGGFNSSFEEAFQEFTTWNYFTGDRADPLNKYSESDLWTDTVATIYFTDEVPYDTLDLIYDDLDHTPEPLSANYIVFSPWFALPTGGLRGWFTGGQIYDPRNEWRFNILGWDAIEHVVEPIDITDNTGIIAFRSWRRYEDIVMIPSVFGYNYLQESTGYSLKIVFDPALNDNAPLFYDFPSLIEVRAGDCAELEVYAYEPNGDEVIFSSEPSHDSLTITSTSDTSAVIRFCPGYDLVDSIISFTMYASDADTNYDAKLLSFFVQYFDQSDSRKVSLVGYPNPFSYDNHQIINLRYSVPDSVEADEVELYVFNVAGDLVYNYEYTDLDWIAPGEMVIEWDALSNSDKYLAGGIYIIKLRAGNNSASAKIAIIR